MEIGAVRYGDTLNAEPRGAGRLRVTWPESHSHIGSIRVGRGNFLALLAAATLDLSRREISMFRCAAAFSPLQLSPVAVTRRFSPELFFHAMHLTNRRKGRFCGRSRDENNPGGSGRFRAVPPGPSITAYRSVRTAPEKRGGGVASITRVSVPIANSPKCVDGAPQFLQGSKRC